MPRISAAEVIASQRAYLAHLNALRVARVAAASARLHAPDGSGRQADFQTKQETPGLRSEGLYRSQPDSSRKRGPRAHSDRSV